MFNRQGLIFREIELFDFTMLRNQRNTQWVGYRDPTSVQTMENQRSWYKTLGPDNQAYMVVDNKEEVGLLRFSQFDHQNRSVGITGVDVWFPGKGYATKIMRAAAEYMLHDLGYHRITGECTEANVGMRRAMEKAGYTLEGRKRSYIWREGKWHDFLQFSLLAEELWPEEKPQPPQGL